MDGRASSGVRHAADAFCADLKARMRSSIEAEDNLQPARAAALGRADRNHRQHLSPGSKAPTGRARGDSEA